MDDEQKQRMAKAAVRMEVASARIAAEVTRIASDPNMTVILDALAVIDEARRDGFHDLLVRR